MFMSHYFIDYILNQRAQNWFLVNGKQKCVVNEMCLLFWVGKEEVCKIQSQMVTFFSSLKFLTIESSMGWVLVHTLSPYHIVTKHPPCGRHCFSCWEHNSEQNHVKSLLWWASISVGEVETDNKPINKPI